MSSLTYNETSTYIQPNGTFHYIYTYNCEQDNAVDPDVAGIGVRASLDV